MHLLLALVFLPLAIAADAEVEAPYRQLQVGEWVPVTMNLRGTTPGKPTLEPVEGLSVQLLESRVQHQVVGGVMTRSSSWTFCVTGTKAGTWVLSAGPTWPATPLEVRQAEMPHPPPRAPCDRLRARAQPKPHEPRDYTGAEARALLDAVSSDLPEGPVGDGASVVILLDVSGSMRANFSRTSRTRLDVAKSALSTFLRNRPQDRLGVVVFAEQAFTLVPLTADHDAAGLLVDQVEIGVTDPKATAVGDALAVALYRLRDVADPRAVVVVTDGANNAGDATPAQMADVAAALHVPIHVVSLDDHPSPFASGLSPALEYVATRTGGQLVRPASIEELRAALQTIGLPAAPP